MAQMYFVISDRGVYFSEREIMQQGISWPVAVEKPEISQKCEISAAAKAYAAAGESGTWNQTKHNIG